MVAPNLQMSILPEQNGQSDKKRMAAFLLARRPKEHSGFQHVLVVRTTITPQGEGNVRRTESLHAPFNRRRVC